MSRVGKKLRLDYIFFAGWRIIWEIFVLITLKNLMSKQVIARPMFGAFGKAGSANSIAFVSKA